MFYGIKLNQGQYAYVNVNLITCVEQAREGNGCTVYTTDGNSYWTDMDGLELIGLIEAFIEKAKK